MQQSKCKTGYSPIYMTLVFMFGTVVGMLTADFHHTPMLRNVIIIAVATIAFHLTHKQPEWLSKFLNKVS